MSPDVFDTLATQASLMTSPLLTAGYKNGSIHSRVFATFKR